MNNLVHLKGDYIFTDSLIIAEGTKNHHKSIKQTITDYEDRLNKLGTLSFLKRQSQGGRPEEIIELNEPQATFLITLLRNNDTVVDFKLALVKEFYEMRKFILERASKQWQEARTRCKLTRNSETDVIKNFIEYSKIQGSQGADKYYIHFSNLVNKAVGIEAGQREYVNWRVLRTLEILEELVLHTVMEELVKEIHYKDIFKTCKNRVEQAMKFIYLPEQRLLSSFA